MKLTSERRNGIKTGYWSSAKKDELVQKLGAIEDRAPWLLAAVCEDIRRHHPPADKEHDAACHSCPVNELVRLIGI
ncbi:hypothetical protein RWV98_17690 [Agathobaculum sp. NTUH-O15-33]|uniref:hypothetical protein n=1 Tax=Agathobaculum sp. NTUH-O15-33 TaxID=3079302 RepID=UPI002958891D|nr:hypothetical protein [Agathobaculum sp. NTUH-O15-33]WNX84383.1 hypothetical protein RWV98_17690 [Agathobaculum sp. NTUH-O15-33]